MQTSFELHADDGNEWFQTQKADVSDIAKAYRNVFVLFIDIVKNCCSVYIQVFYYCSFHYGIHNLKYICFLRNLDISFMVKYQTLLSKLVFEDLMVLYIVIANSISNVSTGCSKLVCFAGHPKN